MVDAGIFRSYDIRGLVETQLTVETVELIGKAYGTMAARDEVKKVSVGYDCRDSSPVLSDALIRGITSTGIDVVNLGCVPTPIQYFSLYHLDVDGGIEVTGSHNPPEYNGFKIAIQKNSLHGEKIQEIREIIEGGEFVTGQGKSEQYDIFPAYKDFCAKNIKLGARKLKVVVDGGNGTAGPFALPVFEEHGVEVIPLFCEMDATFPNHHPDPTVEENLVELQRAVLAHEADLGIAFDGDGDRIGVVDEKGQILWGDQLLILFARAILKEEPGATIVGEVKCSQVMYDDIEKHGGNAVMWKTGHSLIKDKMKKVKAAIAGEMSGHIFFKHRFFGFDDATYAGLRLLEIVSQTNLPLSELLADVPKLHSTPELRVDCPEELKFELVAKVTQFFKEEGHTVIDIDGARVVFDDGWGLVRCSNTGPILVMRFEAENPARLAEIRKYVEDSVQMMRERIS